MNMMNILSQLERTLDIALSIIIIDTITIGHWTFSFNMSLIFNCLICSTSYSTIIAISFYSSISVVYYMMSSR